MIEWERILFSSSTRSATSLKRDELHLAPEPATLSNESPSRSGQFSATSGFVRSAAVGSEGASGFWEYDLDRVIIARDENTIGSDTRRRVSAGENVIFDRVVRLISSFPEADTLGSGFILRTGAVVTAAHNVWSLKYGGHSSGISLWNPSFPMRGQQAALMAQEASFPRQYRESENKDFDFALLRFESAATMAFDPIVIPGRAIEAFTTGKTYEVYGFPADKGGDTLWGASGEADHVVSARRLYHTMDTEAGQSGGPVFERDHDELELIGVHIQGGFRTNSALFFDALAVDAIGQRLR